MKIGKKKANEFAGKLRYQNGLIPVVVTEEGSGLLLMQAYANKEAVVRTLVSGSGYFFSRSRKSLWMKGEASGNRLRVVFVAADCDMDCLQYSVEVAGKGDACHLNRKSCFVEKFGKGKARLRLAALDEVIDSRVKEKSAGSYTARLASDMKFACEKIDEESGELVEALLVKPKKEVVWEACDLIYHALVAARGRGVRLVDLEREFARRHSEKTAKKKKR